MMKIHTTQNLNSSKNELQTTNNLSLLKDFRFNNKNYLLKEAESSDMYQPSISFGKKGPNIMDAKKILKASKKVVGDISKEPHPEVKKGDSIIESPLFNWVLDKYEFEPVIQAAASAIICIGLRPATILALPSKEKSKEDNIYASSHSIASGLIGLLSAIILTAPFKAGGKYVTDVLRKNFDPKVLERLYPQLDTNSIWQDAAQKLRKPIKEWKNKDGNKFIDNINDIQFLPKFKQLADVSDLTYKKVLNLDVDWASQKGKSFNDVVLKDGSKLYDKIDMSKLGIVVKEGEYKPAQILLQDLDKEYLGKLIQDSKGNNWGNLDINSVYAENGAIKDFRQWKDLSGKEWKLDLDETYISSPIEEIERYPRISGNKRFDRKDKEYKFTVYQNNGVNGKLGTAINNTIVEKTARNDAQEKLLTWGPDIITRVPVAATTIALIPWVLKHVFGIEKKKKTPDKQVENNVNVEKQADNVEAKKSETTSNNEQVNFKGGPKPDNANWLKKLFGKYYGKPIMESDKIANLAEKLNKLPGSLTTHMMTLGSLITSSVYVTRTMQNKDMDNERKRTLAINQGLCFVIPTIAAYTVDKLLQNRIKKAEYRISNKRQYARDLAEFKGTEIPKFAQNPKNIKGLRIISSIGVFALIYRYITPVIITPIANWLGEKWNNSAKQKEEQLADNKTKEIKTAA